MAVQMQTEPEGVLILDKPEGLTSHDCVGRIRRLYHTRKVGHTGTLDPMATGVLPILIGRAAKAAEFLTAENKHYLAVLRLGLITDTEDITGEVLSACDTLPAPEAVEQVIRQFEGEIHQVPPMYSALKVNGQKLCDLARQGKTVVRKPRPVTIFRITAKQESASDYQLDVYCSKGTYIRTLCADIGAALGCGGVMASLRRAESGTFSLAQACTLEALEAMTEEERLALLRPAESLFSDCRAVHLPPFYARLADNGQEIYLHKLKPAADPPYEVGEYLRMYSAEKGFFALGQVQNYKNENGENCPAIRSVKKFVL